MVLGSANQLFLKIRASLNRCVKLVSRGNTLLRLSVAFKVQTGLLAARHAWVVVAHEGTVRHCQSAAPPVTYHYCPAQQCG